MTVRSAGVSVSGVRHHTRPNTQVWWLALVSRGVPPAPTLSGVRTFSTKCQVTA